MGKYIADMQTVLNSFTNAKRWNSEVQIHSKSHRPLRCSIPSGTSVSVPAGSSNLPADWPQGELIMDHYKYFSHTVRTKTYTLGHSCVGEAGSIQSDLKGFVRRLEHVAGYFGFCVPV